MSKLVTHPVALRHLTVSKVVDVAPRLRRVTLTGDELRPFSANGFDLPGFITQSPDDHVKLFLAPPEGGDVVLPVQADGHLDWPEDHSVINRDYTVRRYDADAGELDVDLVLHGGGVASTWAETVVVGDKVHMAGPRTSMRYPDAAHVVLVGDLTAIPTIARWVEEAPATTRFDVVVAATDATDEIALRRQDGSTVDVVWLHAASGRRLVDVVTDLPPFGDDIFVFVAAELTEVVAVRKHLKDERGLTSDQFRATSYWRKGGSPQDDHLAGHTLEEMGDLLTPFAIRVAATLRLADHVVAGARSAADLAARADADPVTVDALVGHLATKRVFERQADGTVALGAVGAALLDDHESGMRRRFDLHGAEGRMGQAFAGLLHTATTATSGYEHVFGIGFWDDLQGTPALGQSFDTYIARWATMWVPLVRDAHDWTAHRHIVDVGGGIGLLLVDLLKAVPDARGTLVELPTAVETARHLFAHEGLADRADALDVSFFDALPEGDAFVLAQVLHDWPDEESGRILARCAEALADGGQVLVIERLPVEGQGDQHASMTLLMRNLFAGTERDLDDFIRLGKTAGLTLTGTAPLGYGLHVLTYSAES